MGANDYNFKPSRPLTSEEVKTHFKLPGVYYDADRNLLRCQANAAWLVERVINQLGLDAVMLPPKPRPAVPVLPRPAEIRPEVKLFPYQEDGILWGLCHDGSILWHPCGAGKSLSAAWWALCQEGPTVFVTGAKGRITIARDIEKFTTADVMVLEGRTLPPPVKHQQWVKASDPQLVRGRRARLTREMSLAGVAALMEEEQVQVFHSAEGGALQWLNLVKVTDRVRTVWAVCPECRGPEGKQLTGWFEVEGAVREGRRVVALDLQCRTKTHSFRFAKPEKGFKRETFLKFITSKVEKQRAPRFIIVGWDILPTQLPFLLGLKPKSVVWDEIHRAKGHKRNEVIVDEAGGKRFDPLGNIVSAASQLSKVVPNRLGTTASFLKDRVRDYWGQLDLVEPWGWGGFYQFADRHCAMRDGQYGGVDTTGRSNMEELVQRLSMTIHHVPYSVTHAQLPAKRRQVCYIPVSEQDAPDSFSAELRAALKTGKTNLIEVKLKEAASRKRSWVLEECLEAIGSGQKIMVLTGRRQDCESLEHVLRKALPACQLWMSHGDHSLKMRQAIQDEYMAHPGPCINLGTMDAWGEQLNCQDTDLMLLPMLPVTAGQVIQVEGRVSRVGQRRPVLIKYPVAEGSVDEHLVGILLGKLPAIDAAGVDVGLADFAKGLAGGQDSDKIIEALFKAVTTAQEEVDY